MTTKESAGLAIRSTLPAQSRLGYGCMQLGGAWDDSALDDAITNKTENLVMEALEQGVNLFDHADIYTLGKSEQVFGRVLGRQPALRQQIYIQSKCGIRFAGDPVSSAPARYDFSYGHIIDSVEQSLERLHTDYLDCLLLHRPDPLVEYEDVARAFDELYRSGKVRSFGVSNHSASQIKLLSRFVDQPIVVNQLELSLLHCGLVDDGVMVNTAQPAKASVSGILDYCRLEGIQVQAWSPLAGGGLFQVLEDADPRQPLAAMVANLAAEKECSLEAILLAWLLRHPAGIQPIVGTTDIARLRRACEAVAVCLSREDWYQLFTAARGEPVP
ncbi:MAG: aldo/keto reductase [Motiliproteus sp.]